MQAVINGANERPSPITTPGTGSGLFLLTGDRLTLQVDYRGLTGTATRAHIHGPADSETPAGVMIDLEPYNGGAFGAAGSFSGAVTLTPDQLVAIASRLSYVNIHTEANPGGEVRGQILPCITAVPFSANLGGVFERPTPVTSDGSGSGILALEGDTLVFSISYRGLSGPATRAHFHGPADAANSAGVIIDLEPFNGGSFGPAGTLAGQVTLTAEQKAMFLGARTYANVHTAANASGEIRGQVVPVLMTAALSGANERPDPVETTATGSGPCLFAVDRRWMNVTYRGLSGPATMAHIHGPADVNTSTGVLLDLQPLHLGAFAAAGAFAGNATPDPATVAALVDGLTYVNVHSGSHPAGEIRGQIVRPGSP
jgi:hypothetical protein